MNQKHSIIIIISIMIFLSVSVGCMNDQGISKTSESIQTESSIIGEDGLPSSPSTSALPSTSSYPSISSTTYVSPATESLQGEKDSLNQADSAAKITTRKEYKTYSEQELDKLVTERYDIIDPLIQEKKYWMHQLDQKYSIESLIKVGKYIGIGHQAGSKEENEEVGYTDWAAVYPNATNYIRQHPFIPIISRMTGDFVLTTAIVQPIGNEYKEFYEIINNTRDSEDEVEFLKGLNSLISSDGYYAIDVYVEDELKLERKIPYKGIKLYTEYATNLEEKYDNIQQMPDDSALKEYLNKYNRTVNFSDELQNEQWNLFIFKKRTTQPAIIEIDIRTYERVGGIDLRQKIWYGDN